eukprot:UN04171
MFSGATCICLLYYSSMVVSDFYWFLLVNGIALSPTIAKVTRKMLSRLQEIEPELIEQTKITSSTSTSNITKFSTEWRIFK